MKPEDLTPTGRVVPGAAVDLVEYVHQGHYSTGLRWRGSLGRREAVSTLVAEGGPFLRSPMVTGICELDHWVPAAHELIYPTGRTWSLGELLACAREQGQALGLRAALEVAYLGGMLLQDGHEPGESNDLPLHGNPNPWRWMLDEDAELHLVGWGIPALELYAQDDDPELVLPAPCYQYLSPERLQGGDEDLSSDLFALTLVVAECIAGQPVYSTNPVDAKHEVLRADASRNLYTLREQLPSEVYRFLSRALAQYPDGRFDDVEDYVQEAHNLLYSPFADGPGLARVMERWAAKSETLPAASEPGPEEPLTVSPKAALRWERPDRGNALSSDRRSRSSSRPASRRVVPVGRGPRRVGGTADSGVEALMHRLRSSEGDRPHHPRRYRALRDRNSLFPRQGLAEPTERYLFELPDGHSVWARLSDAESLALSAARVADKACPSPIDASGQLSGWFRIGQTDAAWYGDALTEVLDPAQECRLRFVKNRIITAWVRIDGVLDEPIEVNVGSAVVARFIVSHLRQRFDLRARDWQLWAEEERPLDPWQILDDHDVQDGVELVLRRGKRSSRGWRR